MNIKRNQEPLVKQLLAYFPIVTILGSRQCGKTTLAKKIAPTWQYFDCENPSDYDQITYDPEFFFSQHPEHVIFDEAQRAAQLFEIMRGVVDKARTKKGRFILTGSSSPSLQKHVSESLAGRIAFVELPTLKANEYCRKPLSKFYEIFEKNLDKNSLEIIEKQKALPIEKIQHIWLYGGYPEPLLANDPLFHSLWMKQYNDTYVNRDIAQLFPQLNTLAYQRFLTMLCHLSGTILNKSDIARAIGVSEKSIRDYLEIASGTFLWRQIPSYEKTETKSIVKLPKGYIRDTGLLHYLLNIDSIEKLYSHPIAGRSFENFVSEEILKGLLATQTTNWKARYYRTRRGAEIDLILEGKFGVLPIEIKLGSKIQIKQLKHLETFVEENKLPFGLLVNQAKKPIWLTKKIFQLPVGYL